MTNSEIDRLVAEKVMGWPRYKHSFAHYYTEPGDGNGRRYTSPQEDYKGQGCPECAELMALSPSTNLNHAVEACSGRSWALSTGYDGYHGTISQDAFQSPIGEVRVCAATPALALSLALLKAVGVEG